MFSLIRRLFVVLAILVIGVGVHAEAIQQETVKQMPPAAIGGFQLRVGEYAALHRRLEGPLPPPESSHSARALQLNRTFLASAIKAARPNARQGDIFTRIIGQSFRDLIADAVRQGPPETGRGLIEQDTTMPPFRARVYDSCSDWAAREVPVGLRRGLPTLPEDIEYRLVARDLILCDVHADLIVDVLINVIPRSTT